MDVCAICGEPAAEDLECEECGYIHCEDHIHFHEESARMLCEKCYEEEERNTDEEKT